MKSLGIFKETHVFTDSVVIEISKDAFVLLLVSSLNHISSIIRMILVHALRNIFKS